MLSVCFFFQSISFFLKLLLSKDKILTANSAAFFAPAFPTANVAVGTPNGICTIDSRLSRPFIKPLSIGTPKTGKSLKDDIIPGKCAAPPAPAMITLKPFS